MDKKSKGPDVIWPSLPELQFDYGTLDEEALSSLENIPLLESQSVGTLLTLQETIVRQLQRVLGLRINGVVDGQIIIEERGAIHLGSSAQLTEENKDILTRLINLHGKMRDIIFSKKPSNESN